MTEPALPRSRRPAAARRLILAGIAAIAVAGAALARPLAGSPPAALATGTAFQSRVTVAVAGFVAPVSVKIPVPAGKRLDIERVTMAGTIQPVQPAEAPIFTAVLTTTVGGQKGDFPLPQPSFVPFPNSLRPLNLFTNVPMFGAFADGGANSPVITIDRTDVSFTGLINVTISGRLE